MTDNVILDLFLVRHGESASQAGLTENMPPELRNDCPLSPKGEEQARLLGEYFADFPLDAVLSSPLRRSMSTGYAVVSRQPSDGAKKIQVHRVFTECGTGENTVGRTIEEIRGEIPAAVLAPGQDESEKVIFYSDGHDDDRLLQRGREAVNYILSRYHSGEKVMVTAHAAFNTFMFFAALGLECPLDFDPQFFNTGITKIRLYETGKGPFSDVHLVYQNAVPHLIGEMSEFKY